MVLITVLVKTSFSPDLEKMVGEFSKITFKNGLAYISSQIYHRVQVVDRQQCRG